MVEIQARLRRASDVAGVDERSLEPGVEPLRIAEAGQLAPGDHQRLLHRVLGEVDVAEDAARDPEEQVPTRAGQDGERLPVARAGPARRDRDPLAPPSRWRASGAPSEPTE